MPLRQLLTGLAFASACTAAEPPTPVRAPVTAPPPAAPTMPTIQPTAVSVLAGVVHEIQSVGHYTYVRLGRPDHLGNWAVVMGSLDAAPGDTLTLSVHGSQTDFHSRRLDRDFEQLFFASVPSRA